MQKSVKNVTEEEQEEEQQQQEEEWLGFRCGFSQGNSNSVSYTVVQSGTQ